MKADTITKVRTENVELTVVKFDVKDLHVCHLPNASLVPPGTVALRAECCGKLYYRSFSVYRMDWVWLRLLGIRKWFYKFKGWA